MNRALPLKLWLELEDSVNHHKAEVARGFTEARERLLPPLAPPKPDYYAWIGGRAVPCWTPVRVY